MNCINDLCEVYLLYIRLLTNYTNSSEDQCKYMANDEQNKRHRSRIKIYIENSKCEALGLNHLEVPI